MAAQPSLLSLPTELRLMVYKFALQADNHIRYGILWNKDKEERCWYGLENGRLCKMGLGLLRTCSLIHQEASPIYYSINTFDLDVETPKLHHTKYRSLVSSIQAGNRYVSRPPTFWFTHMENIMYKHPNLQSLRLIVDEAIIEATLWFLDCEETVLIKLKDKLRDQIVSARGLHISVSLRPGRDTSGPESKLQLERLTAFLQDAMEEGARLLKAKSD